jgi:hypothetical protein
MPSTNPMIALRLDPGLYAEVVELAHMEGRSVANWVRRYVRLLVEDGHAETTYVRSGLRRSADGLRLEPIRDPVPSSRPGGFQTHVRTELARPGEFPADFSGTQARDLAPEVFRRLPRPHTVLSGGRKSSPARRRK